MKTSDATIPIRGNTYPVKDKLKALGCRWNSAGKCWMATPEIAEQAKQIVGGTAYNSPPPRDLGPLDVNAEVAKHQRVALSAEIVSFRRHSAKGEQHAGQTLWGKHNGVRNLYLVLSSSKPYYLNRDQIEDFDLFHLSPGWYVDCECVAIEPTEDEKANDPAVAKQKKEAQDKARREIVFAVQQAANYKDNADITGMTKCWGESRMAGHEGLWSDGANRLVYEKSDYDMGPQSWELVDPELAKRAMELKDPA